MPAAVPPMSTMITGSLTIRKLMHHSDGMTTVRMRIHFLRLPMSFQSKKPIMPKVLAHWRGTDAATPMTVENSTKIAPIRKSVLAQSPRIEV